MLYVSASLVLSAAEQAIRNNPIILWNNVVTVANVSATASDADHPVSYLGNPATHLFWRGSVLTFDDYVTVATGYSGLIDGVGIARHNFFSQQIPVSIEVCTSLSNSPQVWTEVVSPHIPPDDAPLLFWFTAGVYEGVRVRMGQASGGRPEIGALYVHKLLILERSVVPDEAHTPINLGRTTQVYSGRSASGNFLGRRVVGEGRTSQFDFKWFTSAFYRASVDPFVISSQELPFFIAWNPSEYLTDVGYCWTTEDPVPKFDPVTRRVHLTMKLQGIA